MNHYLWWIPTLLFLSVWNAWLSIQVNKNPSSWLFYLMWIPVGLWPFISKLSKNLVFDGMLYDSLTCVFYVTGFILFGASKGFSITNYVGLSIVIVGFILMKI